MKSNIQKVVDAVEIAIMDDGGNHEREDFYVSVGWEALMILMNESGRDKMGVNYNDLKVNGVKIKRSGLGGKKFSVCLKLYEEELK